MSLVADDRVETVDLVRGIVDNTVDTIGLYQRVRSLNGVTVASFFLFFDVTGVAVVDGVREFVMSRCLGLGVDVLGDGSLGIVDRSWGVLNGCLSVGYFGNGGGVGHLCDGSGVGKRRRGGVVALLYGNCYRSCGRNQAGQSEELETNLYLDINLEAWTYLKPFNISTQA